jgi:dolichol-phosphate mannosyltransferase
MNQLAPGSVTFFIPCLNEEGNVGRTIDTIVSLAPELSLVYEIIVVDDASSDGSVNEVLERRQRYPGTRIELIKNPICRGLGRNYFVAAQRAHGEYFMVVNGDAAEPVEALRLILSHKGKADAVVPYLGSNDTRSPARRRVSRLFTLLVNVVSGHRLRYYNGPVLHKAENVRMWFAETTGFGYQAELLCRLLDEGISVEEVQMVINVRDQGVSKAFRFGNFLAVSNTLFHILLRRLERWTITRFPPPPRRRAKP